MEENLKTIDDLQLSEIAITELEIMGNSIPDTYTVEVMEEVVRRFREKIAH